MDFSSIVKEVMQGSSLIDPSGSSQAIFADVQLELSTSDIVTLYQTCGGKLLGFISCLHIFTIDGLRALVDGVMDFDWDDCFIDIIRSTVPQFAGHI